MSSTRRILVVPGAPQVPADKVSNISATSSNACPTPTTFSNMRPTRTRQPTEKVRENGKYLGLPRSSDVFLRCAMTAEREQEETDQRVEREARTELARRRKAKAAMTFDSTSGIRNAAELEAIAGEP